MHRPGPAVTVAGEMDAATAPAFDERADSAIRSSRGTMILDLTRVDSLE
ncbi:STAS domain-containing protein [Rhodococcus sp. NPDC003318]